MVSENRVTASARISAYGSRVLDLLSGGLLLVIVATTLAEVAGRYILSQSFVWSGELTRLLHIWMVLMAAAKASHMRITLVVERVGSIARSVLQIANGVLALTMLAVLVYGGLVMMDLTARDFYTGMKVPVSVAFLALVVGASVWALGVIVSMFAGQEN